MEERKEATREQPSSSSSRRRSDGNKNSNSGISDNSISHDVAQCLFSILRRRMSDAWLPRAAAAGAARAAEVSASGVAATGCG